MRDTPAHKKRKKMQRLMSIRPLSPYSPSFRSTTATTTTSDQTQINKKNDKRDFFRNIMEACDTYSCTSHFTPTKSLFLWHSKRKETRNKHKKSEKGGWTKEHSRKQEGKT